MSEIYGNHQQLLVDSGDTLWLVLLAADFAGSGLRISFVCKELQASQGQVAGNPQKTITPLKFRSV